MCQRQVANIFNTFHTIVDVNLVKKMKKRTKKLVTTRRMFQQKAILLPQKPASYRISVLNESNQLLNFQGINKLLFQHLFGIQETNLRH